MLTSRVLTRFWGIWGNGCRCRVGRAYVVCYWRTPAASSCCRRYATRFPISGLSPDLLRQAGFGGLGVRA